MNYSTPDYTAIKGLLVLVGLAALALGIIGLVIRSAVGGARTRPTFGGASSGQNTTPQPPQHQQHTRVTPGFPVISRTTTLPPVPSPAPPAALRFRVTGVDRESRMDCFAVYEAATPANARAKAELDGVVVTEVTPISD